MRIPTRSTTGVIVLPQRCGGGGGGEWVLRAILSIPPIQPLDMHDAPLSLCFSLR
ncbi:hypothetical protein B0O80DRAFT_433537 [Mortierella sp. GBAus27b]|nr:hypothetical protein B0O80DRAFT_433537 [Mortierella sp. GBAus27b]